MAGQYKTLKIVTSIYQFVGSLAKPWQAITRNLKWLLQFTICGKSYRTLADHYKIIEIVAPSYHLWEVLQDLGRPLQETYNCCFKLPFAGSLAEPWQAITRLLKLFCIVLSSIYIGSCTSYGKLWHYDLPSSRLPDTVPLLDSSDAEPKTEGRLSCDNDLICDDKGEGRSDDVDALGLGTGEILGL